MQRNRSDLSQPAQAPDCLKVRRSQKENSLNHLMVQGCRVFQKCDFAGGGPIEIDCFALQGFLTILYKLRRP